MTEAQALQAIFTGAAAAMQAADDGVQLLGIGEMGIGNTTTSAAVLCALTGKAVKALTGKGAGLTAQSYETKCAVIERTLKTNRADAQDVIDVLAKLGGFDIAGIVFFQEVNDTTILSFLLSHLDGKSSQGNTSLQEVITISSSMVFDSEIVSM